MANALYALREKMTLQHVQTPKLVVLWSLLRNSLVREFHSLGPSTERERPKTTIMLVTRQTARQLIVFKSFVFSVDLSEFVLCC